MLHVLTYGDARWRVETTGLRHEADGLKSVGVRFVCEDTGQEVFGSLNLADVQRPTDARLVSALETTLKHLGPVDLVLREKMWSRDGQVMNRDNPIMFEVRGLPPGFEQILVAQNLAVRPIRWYVMRTRDGQRGWADDYETPEAALAQLRAEFNTSTPAGS